MCRPPATVDGGAAPPPLGKEFLAEAPRAVCAVVCGLYLALSCRGATHLRRIIADGHADPDALFRDFGALLALYGAETALAAAGGATTMYHWTRRNFLEHHLPLALVGGCMLACCGATQGRALVQHEEWCSLILLISFNEASAAFLILRPDPTLQAFRIGPNLLIQVSLLATELGSYARAMRAQNALRDPAMALPGALSQFLLAAAVVHVSYIGQIVASVRKRPPAEIDVAAKGLAVALALALTIFSAPPPSR